MNKLAFIALLITIPFFHAYSQDNKINVVIIGSHPDDADKQAGGTALEFLKRDHNVLFVSLTTGDAGHQTQGGKELAQRRFSEAQEAGRRFGVEYIVMDNPDGKLLPAIEIREEIIRIIRKFKADIVIGHRPNAMHPDRRNSAILLQDAAYMVIVPNVVPGVPPLLENPLFLYFEDNFKKPNSFKPDIVVDITSSFEQKIYGMAAHESQFFEWQPWIAKTLDKVPENEQERLEWLASISQGQLTKEKQTQLIKWYGKAKAKKVNITESFEICEYGKRPDDKEIRRLFPMLGN
ncbi:MAG TPA: PIG-L family deacetylase [Mariniphaga anaerophila]|uniref:PIG-L family deacetylase n=1 Tax=Mariniphaga anaerophila TaxID=1484053 RepID=A0A831PK29_9BACT|nr:PIG-L family deacetylase [Mariniphaga anaerophila]